MLKTTLAAAALLAAAGAADAATVNVAIYTDFTDTGSGIAVSGAPAVTGSFQSSDNRFDYDWTKPGSVGGYDQNDVFAADLTGAFTVSATGTYNLGFAADDAGYLFVDGKLVLSEPGAHGIYWNDVNLDLSEGVHTFKIEYDNDFCCSAIVSLSVPNGVTLTTAASAPEPSTWVMLGLGFAGLGFAGYRRASTTRFVQTA